MTVVLIQVLLLVLLSVVARRWGADTRDGRDWARAVDIPGAARPTRSAR